MRANDVAIGTRLFFIGAAPAISAVSPALSVGYMAYGMWAITSMVVQAEKLVGKGLTFSFPGGTIRFSGDFATLKTAFSLLTY